MKFGLGRQTPVPFLGVYKQLLGGASSWVILATFVFSGVTMWNTHTMTVVREALPGLSLPVFAGVMVVGLHFAMWLEHRYVQPSVMVYWNRMFYAHGNPMKEDLEKLTAKVDALDEKLSRLIKHDEGHS